MGVYSNKQIRQAILGKHIICHPLIDENIRGSSIDMTLGEWYYLCDRSMPGVNHGVYNPFYDFEVKKYFGDPLKASSLQERRDWVGRKNKLKGISDDHPIIMIPKRSRILAHTHEFIGIHPPGTTEMRARSSWGRNGIAVCLCAGWGDPGYINRWTMEIHNMNDEAVPIPIGERVAQLVFHETGPVSGHYGSEGKYQGSTDVEELVKAWGPEAMLPRSYTDERRLPLPV